MPFKSEAQRRFLYATNPKVAKKFSAHTPKGKKLPYKVKQANRIKAFFRGLLKKGKENPAQTVAMLVVPGAGVAVPAAHAVKAANKKFGQSVGQPMARAMQKNPDYKNSVLRGLLKTGSLEKSAAKKSLVSSLLKGGKKKRIGEFLEDFAKSRNDSRMATDVLAHELGHAKAFGKSGPFMRSLRGALYGSGSAISTGLNATSLGSAYTGKFSGKRALIQAAGEAPKLLEEAAATYYGLKAMKGLKYISPKQYKNARSNLFRAYGSYALPAAGRITGAGIGPMTRNAAKLRYGIGQEANDLAAIALGGQAGALLGGPLIQGLKKNQSILVGARGGASTKRQAKALAKKMGVNPLIISSSKTRVPGNAFSMQAEDVGGLGSLIMLNRKKIGKRGMRKALRDGVVSAPTMRLSEVSGSGGRKSRTEKALSILESIGKNMQKRQS